MKQVKRTSCAFPKGRSGSFGRIMGARVAVAALWVCLAAQLVHGAGDQASKRSKAAQACVNIEGHTAPVRAIVFTPDSRLLCTAGLDKVVHVWKLPEPNSSSGGRTKQIVRERSGKVRTLRWPTGRGPRGMIYAMAVHPKTGQLAIGGYGNLQLTGEIVWLDPYLGEWVGAGYKHFFASIGALSYSADGSWLASVDIDGRALLWPSVGGEPRELASSDAVRRDLTHRPLVMVGNERVVLPVHDRGAGPKAVWKLRQYAVPSGSAGRILAADHVQEVTTLAASADGRYFASADQAGNLFVWRPGEPRPWKRWKAGQPVVSMAFSPDGQTLAAGTRLVPGGDGTQLQVWDVAAGTVLRRRQLHNDVNACAISPDGQRLAYTGGGGYEVFVESIDSPHEVLTISGGQRVVEAAFARDGSDYDVVFKSLPVSLFSAEKKTFSASRLEAKNEARPAITSTQYMGRWSYVSRLDDPQNANLDPYRLWLYRDRQPQACIQLEKQVQGHLTSTCWIPGPNGEPVAVAVGTAIQNGIYVYGLPRDGKSPLLRYCRGHYGRVTSLNASRDGTYVLSGSADGTIRFWTLRGCRSESAVFRRWGAVLQAPPDGRGLMVNSIDNLGPLYQKGVREGDRIDKIAWGEPGSVPPVEQPAEMLRQLDLLPWNLQVSFYTSRNGAERQPFNLRGGWHQIMTLCAAESEWIAWTPAGYYACSPGGERMIGWLVNPNEINRPPSFYTAEQFHQALYRPDIIRGLLKAGSVDDAFDATGTLDEHDRVEVLADVEPPQVRIITPGERVIVIDQPRITVTAVAEARDGRPVTAMRLHLDDRPYEKQSFAKAIVRQTRRKSQTWNIELEPGRHSIQVAAESDGSEGYSREIFVTYSAPPGKPRTRPSLYVLAVGISSYPEQPLNYAHSDAEQVASILKGHTSELFERQEIRKYVNREAVKSRVIEGLQWLRTQMKPQDVGVFFYSGHGMKDDDGNFYLFPVDGAPDDLDDTCISDRLLKQYCEATKGRLVLMIDACHSGGIDLRAAETASMNNLARDLSRKEYSVILMASSTGREVSWEHDDWKAGAFAKAVSEGLLGNANMSSQFADNVIETIELDLYVYSRVRQLTREGQTPVSSKPPIAPFALTSVGAGIR